MIPHEIQFPAKLRGLFEPHPYKIMHGGRDSAKSWGVARALLIQSVMGNERVLCTREVQDSIRDSVHRLLSDQVAMLGISGKYTITEREFKNMANGSQFLFAGLQQHTVESIKSFEGVTKTWIEEGQTVSKFSREMLLPTVMRRAKSEAWVTMNPKLETDDSYQFWVANPPPGAWVQKMTWRDNPWFGDLNNALRLDMQARDPDNYANIWEGEPLRVAEGAIYAAEVEALYTGGRVRAVPYDPVLPVDTVWDLGWADSMAIVLCQRSAAELRVVGYIEGSNRRLDEYVSDLEKLPYRWGRDFIPHDGASKDFKTGKSTEELLRGMGRRPVVLTAMSVEEGIRAARTIFPRAYFDAGSTDRLLECLKRYRRIVNRKTGEPMGPLHDEYSHGADAWRYVAQAIERMGKRDDAPASPKVRRPASWQA